MPPASAEKQTNLKSREPGLQAGVLDEPGDHQSSSSVSVEKSVGAHFEFGANWIRFAKRIDEARIDAAVRDLQAMLGCTTLTGKRVLDVGCGSGLTSLAAFRLGARVHSFDYDEKSVACTSSLRSRYAPTSDIDWVVEQGSALDLRYLQRLGRFDVVISWGVLHHSGNLWAGLKNVLTPLEQGGVLYISIYNDQGRISSLWRMVKRAYNALPGMLRPVYVLPFMFYFATRKAVGDVAKRRWPLFRDVSRGMSLWTDVVDWVGGYPFEVAKPEQVTDFCLQRGFTLLRLITCGGRHGCNQFVFRCSSTSRSETT